MSLPSTAYLIKNDEIVADSFVNIGWFLNYNELIKCCYDVYNECIKIEERELEGSIDMHRDMSCILDGWRNFDYMRIYGYVIPRQPLDELFLGKITKEEFIQRFHDGSYKDIGCTWLKPHKEMIEKYSKRIGEKYAQ